MLIDPETLPEMDPVRTAVKGFSSYGFVNDGVTIYVHEEPWFGGTRNYNLKPIFEYHNVAAHYNDYRDQQLDLRDEGSAYERVAFYVHRVQVEHSVALYRYYSGRFQSVLLSIDPDLQARFPENAYQAPVQLGYVHPATSIVPQPGRRCSVLTTGANLSSPVCPLTQYWHYDHVTDNGHHKYTTWTNDKGRHLLKWPGSDVIIGNDLLSLSAPVVNFSEFYAGLFSAQELESCVASVIKGVNRPYEQWGKNSEGNWVVAPRQATVPATGDIIWGRMMYKSPDYEQSHALYIYGVKNINHEENNPNSTQWGSNEIYLARAILEQAEDFFNYPRWQYFSDGQWLPDPALASPVANNIGAQSTISFNSHGNNFVMLSSDRQLLARIHIHTADAITGPFETMGYYDLLDSSNEAQEQSIYSAFYAVHGHDGLSFDEDGILVSYVRIGFYNSPASYYVPRFINLKWQQLIAE